MIDRVTRWLRGSSLDPIGPPIAAVTLPSGDILVFDRAGHVLEPAGGPPEGVKTSVARNVGSSGRFFRMIGETTADGWVEDDLGGLRWENQIELEFTAVECTSDAWVAGGLEGQPAGRATFLVDRKHLRVSPDDVWKLIRDAVLRPPR